MTTRHFLVRLHLWFGLTLGLVWAVQGLTGAALVFHRELDRWGVKITSGPMAPVDRLIAAAERQAGTPVRMLSVADSKGGILQASYKDAHGYDRNVRLDAASARVVDDRSGASGWRWVYNLHEELLLGDRASTLVGLTGLFLASIAATGLWLGWPRRRGSLAALTPSQWQGRRQKLRSWHRMWGLTAAAVLIIVALSGAATVLRPQLWSLLQRTTPFRPPYKAAGPLPESMVTAGDAWSAAQRVFPDGRFVRVTMPVAGSPAYYVRVLRPGEIRAWSGTSSVVVDAGSGRILARHDALTAPWPNRLYDAVFSLHNGEAAGVVGRLLVLLAGLALPVLYVTGLLSWWRRRKIRVAG